MMKYLIVSFIFVFFTSLFTYPAVFHLKDRIIGDGGDNYQFLGFQYIAKLQFEQGKFPFGWTDYWRYPTGFDFGNTYDSTLLMIVGIIGYQFTQNPVIVYNLSVLLFLFLDAFLSYIFFEKVTGDRLLGIMGGLIYGFSFYNIARMGGHPNLILTGCVPYLLYALLYLYQHNGSIRSYILFSFSVILVYFVSLQYVLLVAGAAIIFIPILFVFYQKLLVSFVRLFIATMPRLLASMVVIVAIFLYFNFSKVHAFVTDSLILPGADLVSIEAINYFFPNSYLHVLPGSLFNHTPKWIENAVFVGYLEFILFVIFLTAAKVSNRFKVFIIALAMTFFIITLGDGGNPQLPLPYPILFKVLPFRGIIEAGRFYIILYLVITLAVVQYLGTFLKETGKVGIMLVFAFFVFERLPSEFYLSDTYANKPFIKTVRETTSEGVLDLPIYHEWFNGNLYDLYSVYYKKPIVNGYIHWSGNTPDAIYFISKEKRFECAPHIELESSDPLTAEEVEEEISKNHELERLLVGYGIKTVVVHKTIRGIEDCARVLQRIDILLQQSDIQFIQIYTDQDNDVYYLDS